MPLAAGTRLGPYEVLGLIGAGGMGEVYRARDTRLDRDVAIKVLPDEVSGDADRLRRFEREARALAALNHPNIVSIHDVGSHDGAAYAVMERLEGETLRQSLHRGALPRRKSLEQAIEIARGLGAAHEKGIVHRDLKPENVFVTTDGRVKLLDFGLARQNRASSSGPTEAATVTRDTVPGVVLGTVGYMSPEQVRGAEVDARSDVFAFGCVFYEMLTGRRAFDRETPTETMTAILREDPPDITASGPPASPAVERTMRRCLEKNPAERFQSARDVAFALEAVSGDSRPSGVLEGPPRRLAWRRVAFTTLLGAAVVAGAGMGYVAGRRTGQGGARLSYERLTFRNGAIVNARFGPDGKTVYYGAAWEGSPFRVYQTRPEGGELALPIENADLLSVSRDGQLAVLLLKRFGPNPWWKTGTLAVVPVLGAVPRELAEDVSAADWAPDGKSLAVVRAVGGTTRLEFPLGQVLYESEESPIFNPRVSPSGDLVAFFEGTISGGFSLSIVDRAGRKTELSPGWSDWYDVVWSPDGRELWFGAVSSCAGTQGALHAVDLRGRRRVLAEAAGALDIHDLGPDGRALVGQVVFRPTTWAWGGDGPAERNLSWLESSWPAGLSEDGRFALLNVMSKCTAGAEGSFASYIRSIDGAAPVRVADGFVDDISPDASHVVIGWPGPLRVLSTGAGAGRVLTLTSGTPAQIVWGRRWMPDGKRIAVAVQEERGGMTLRVVDARSGVQQLVSASFVPDRRTGTLWSSAVSPDGRAIAVKAVDGRLLVIPLDGSAPSPVPSSELNDYPAQWGNEPNSLYVFRQGEIPSRVFRVDTSSGKRTLWKEIRPPDTAATGISSLHLTRDGRAGVYGYHSIQVDLYILSGLR